MACSSARLFSAGIPVYPVNPKMAEFVAASVAGAKTDQIDAYLLAKMGRFDWEDLRRLEPDSPTVQELKTLTRDQDSLVQMQTRMPQPIDGLLASDYYPAALHLFTKLQQRSTLVFLQTYPTPQAALATSLEEILAALRAGKHSNPKQAAPKIFSELHAPQLEASALTVRAKSRLMLSLAKQLLVVIEDIESLDKEIQALFLTHEDHELWSSLPGAGKRLAPRLLAEWGDDRGRYTDANSVQALAGTAPVPYQSGNSAKAHKRFARQKPLRNALHKFAWESRLSVNRGPMTPTSASEWRAKATVWRSVQGPTCGYASSRCCG